MTLRSNLPVGSTQWAVRRAQWRAMGYTDADMVKPKIAVINSSSDLSVCFNHLDEIAALVKESVREAGGLAFEVRTVAPSDFITSAGRSGRYLMPSRDLLVNDIEVMVEGAQLDGMVLLSSCDKTTPAHLMAAARLNIPSIVVAGGYQGHGSVLGDEVDIEDVFESVGAVGSGAMSLDRLCRMSDVAVCGSGVCAGMGTANTMHIACEALGMALPGSTPIRANGERVREVAQAAGRRIIDLIGQQCLPRDVMTAESFANALTTCLAVSGSLNMVRHLQAIAMEAQVDVDMYKLLDDLGGRTPLLCSVRPNGPARIEELDDAGGTVGVMKQLGELVDPSLRTVAGGTIGEVLRHVSVDATVIRPASDPVAPGPALVLMRGSLAPGGGLMKLGGKGEDAHFTGTARVFDSQEDALEALKSRAVQAGDVAVLRGLGPVGGPGVASASWFVAALHGVGLGSTVAVVTDGQLSGLNHGLVVGQVSPEAATGGPLSLVQTGDRITIDVRRRIVDLEVAADELARRERENPPPEVVPEAGWLGMYQRLVQPLSRGAVLLPE
jgi:dihydroxy-acid dehydratase